MPQSKSVVIGKDAPLQDAQRAVRMVRYYAEQWHVDITQVGIMGFSAGGHLASTLGTHFGLNNFLKTDSVDDLSCTPRFYGAGISGHHHGRKMYPYGIARKPDW